MGLLPISKKELGRVEVLECVKAKTIPPKKAPKRRG